MKRAVKTFIVAALILSCFCTGFFFSFHKGVLFGAAASAIITVLCSVVRITGSAGRRNTDA